MTKTKPSAQIHVAQGDGGMRQINDLRFENEAWQVERVIGSTAAETWMAHLAAEAEERGLSLSGLWQVDRAENSGTISLRSDGADTVNSIDVVFERRRGGELSVRVRASNGNDSTMSQVEEFIDAVDRRQKAGKTASAHQRAVLVYSGLPWRGELWLDENHRLGPPSQFPESLLGPQAIIVDARIEGVGSQGIASNFSRRLHEIRVFLAVVVGVFSKLGYLNRDWVCDTDESGRLTLCRLRSVGYVELAPIAGFPEAGAARPIERRVACRPGLGPLGITSDVHERWVPTDSEELWNSFMQLPEAKRHQFLRAGNAYLTSRTLLPEQRTAAVGFMVIACEALKPSGKRFDKVNVYDVVAGLLGPAAATHLREGAIAPQRVRSRHFHRGEILAGEFASMMMHDYFADPSFDDMLRDLSMLSRVCLIEWLRRGGEYTIGLSHAAGKANNKSRAASAGS